MTSPTIHHLQVVHLDDDPFELERIRTALTGEPGREALSPPVTVHSLSDPAQLAGCLVRLKPDVVLLDLHLSSEPDPEGSSLALVPACRRLAPEAAIIVLSTVADPALIRGALTAAVDDYLTKETDDRELRRLLVEIAARKRRGRAVAAPATTGPAEAGTAVAGQTMRAIQARVPAILASAISGVHVRGESGTGKEVVAQLFHAAVAPRPFLSVNCAAIAPSLLESTLFGVVRGSFTGATADRRGYLEAASGGWLFLDEVGCLSPAAQAALLRAIENQEIVRVGDNRVMPINVRLISATNADLRLLVEAGQFRLDLWQRLAEVDLVLPALRERPEELHELIDHLVRTLPGGPFVLAPATRSILAALPWREGNVRQLRNCLRAMTERHVGRTLTPQAIPAHYLRSDPAPPSPPSQPSPPSPSAAAATPAASAAAGRAAPLIVPPGTIDGIPYAFDQLTARLFIAAVTSLGRAHGRLSVRQLARELDLSKSSVSRRLWQAVNLGLSSPDDLRAIVRLGSGPRSTS